MLCIDPGHGGWNTGKVLEEYGFLEKDYTLIIAHELAAELNKRNIIWKMTREWDYHMSFIARGDMSMGSDYVISIHINAHRIENVKGGEVYYLPDDDAAHNFANRIARDMPKWLKGRRRRARVISTDTENGSWLQRPMNVLKPHFHSTPVLVELGYITNDHDREHILNDESRLEAVKTLAQSIEEELQWKHLKPAS